MIGASVRRVADQRFVLGRGRYLDDLAPSGCLHLGVVRSTHAHARLVAVHLEAARALVGVSAAWAAADLPEVPESMPSAYSPGGKKTWGQSILVRDVARFVGEPLAVIVADTASHLADALETVTVDYEPLPALARVAEALYVRDERCTTAGPTTPRSSPRAAWATRRRRWPARTSSCSERLRHARLAAAPIETRGVVAYATDGATLVVWSSTQNPYSVRDAIAAALGLPAEEVRVLAPDVGGGFGPKGAVYPEEVLVAARRAAPRPPGEVGRGPARAFRRRPATTASRCTRRASASARTARIVGDRRRVPGRRRRVSRRRATGSRSTPSTTCPGRTASRTTGTSARAYVTNKTQNAAYRGGRAARSRLRDGAADRHRRAAPRPRSRRGPPQNLVRPGGDAVPARASPTRTACRSPTIPATSPPPSSARSTLLGYDGWRTRQAAQREQPRSAIGIGLACYVQGTGLGPYEGATVRVDPSGKVYVNIGVAAQGQGHATTLAQIGAAELGARFEDVHVVAGDTSLFPFGMGTGGSRVAANAGPAVARTAREVRASGRPRGAPSCSSARADDVRIEEGRAFVAGVPDRFVPLGRVAQCRGALEGARSRPASRASTPARYYYPDTVTWAFGTQAAAVEVDLETCAIRLLAYAVVHDRGRAINPHDRRGRSSRAALAQGIGAGLMEEVVYDDDAQLVTGSLMDYAIPKADDAPAASTWRWTSTPRSSTTSASRAWARAAASPGAGAIANAVEDAVADLGVTLTEVPVTSARLFAALSSRRSPRG